MLHEFLAANREELIARCAAKVAKRPIPPPSPMVLTHGIPLFLDQFIETLARDAASDESASRRISGGTDPSRTPTTSEIGEGAARHGDELHRKGFTVDQVVHDYGDLCQTITELAVEQTVPISTTEYRTLNRCLDNAIADAVTRFGSERERSIRDWAAHNTNERLGILAHELRGKLNVVRLAVQAIKQGTVGTSGPTAKVLDRSLAAMSDIIDRSFAEVRLGTGLPPKQERIQVAGLFEEIQIFAGLQSGAKGLELTVRSGEPGLAIHADRHTMVSAISNLVQNAIKFTPSGGHIALAARSFHDRVLIDVEDQCGGLPSGDPKELFRPFVQHSRDNGGLGLGLSISQRGVEANGGKLYVRNRPGTGCVFTIDLERPAS